MNYFISHSQIIIYREWVLIKKNILNLGQSILLFIILLVIFPISITTRTDVLNMFAGSIIWITMTLAITLSLNKLFHEDYHDGTLDQDILDSYPLSLKILIKLLLRWITIGVPIMITIPFAGIIYQLSWAIIETLILTIIFGGIILYFLGSLIAALTVSVKENGLLLVLVLFPLYIPPIIIGSVGLDYAAHHITIMPVILLLLAGDILVLTFFPWLIAQVLKFSCQQR